MIPLEILFALSSVLILYPYGIYPIILWALSRTRTSRIPSRGSEQRPSISIVIAAYNEVDTIGRRIREMSDQMASAGLKGEVIVVSDGSTDGTAAEARHVGGDDLRVIELPTNVGKSAALSVAHASARHDLLIFADARQRWARDALARLVENFSDPDVGAVSGDLVLSSARGTLEGVGFYWRFEKWIRRIESHLDSMVGVTGAISAVRKPLFHPPPPGTILDDVYWPLRVAMQGFRVIHDERALAFDRLPDRTKDEFRRKIRTLAGNYQLLTRLPAATIPWRNPIWWQYLSHKVSRLIAPWGMIGALASSAFLGGWYQVAFWIQAGFYAAALLGLTRVLPRSRIISAISSFVIVNAASLIAGVIFISGQSARLWTKARYAPDNT